MSEPLLLELKKKLSEKGKWVKLAETTATSEQTITVDNLNNYSALVLQVSTSSNSNQILASNIGTVEQFKSGSDWQATFGADSNNYFISCKYVNDTTVKLRSNSSYDRAILFGII